MSAVLMLIFKLGEKVHVHKHTHSHIRGTSSGCTVVLIVLLTYAVCVCLCVFTQCSFSLKRKKTDSHIRNILSTVYQRDMRQGKTQTHGDKQMERLNS